MAFNSNFIRQQRMQKNAAARVARPSNFQNAPFLELNELENDVFNFRLWPSDPTKNPHGFFYQRTHTLLDATGKLVPMVCPRSNNWDPMPYAWDVYDASCADQVRRTTEMPDESNYDSAIPVFKERCWACEVEQQLVDRGTVVEQLPVEVQAWLNGAKKPWREGLLGSDKWYFPCTFRAEVYSREEIVRDDGSKRTNVTYKANPANNFHCVLAMHESKMKDELLRLIEECPDCSNMMLGRWFRLQKQNDGKGVGGYALSINPNPSSAGFDLPSELYPNFASWGKGNAKYNKPSKRLPYETVETLGADPNGFWVPTFRELGIALSDDDPTDIPF